MWDPLDWSVCATHHGILGRHPPELLFSDNDTPLLQTRNSDNNNGPALASTAREPFTTMIFSSGDGSPANEATLYP